MNKGLNINSVNIWDPILSILSCKKSKYRHNFFNVVTICIFKEKKLKFET